MRNAIGLLKIFAISEEEIKTGDVIPDDAVLKKLKTNCSVRWMRNTG